MSTNSSPEAVSARDTVVLQAVAALLIANSHLESLYPRSWMAADGFIGNSIFFFLSGYGITKSLATREQTFAGFYWRRILRIYPTVWIAALVFHFLLLGGWRSAGPADYAQWLLYPSAYNYVQQVMVFYALIFLLRRWLRPEVLPKIFAALFLLLVGLYIFDWINHPVERLQLGNISIGLWWVFFFQATLWGSLIAVRKEPATGAGASANLAKLLGTFLLYVALKFLMVLGIKIPSAQIAFGQFYLLLHLLMFPILLYAWRFAGSEEVREFLRRHVAIGCLAGFIGEMTLEIYTVHRFVLDDTPIHDLKFPLNVLVFFVATLALCFVVKKAADALRSVLAPHVR